MPMSLTRIKGENRGAPYLKYTHRIRVTFQGRFPMDMLRYDHCHPATERSANEIQDSVYDEIKVRTVLIQKYDSRAFSTDVGVWTAGRWRSQGGSIECVTPYQTEDD